MVELVQKPGEPIEIVNIKGKPVVVVAVEPQEKVTTEVTVDKKTGNKVMITTDQKVIKTDSTIRIVNQNVVVKLPELVKYAPVKSETKNYGKTT